jgi:predicted phosphodiesterase
MLSIPILGRLLGPNGSPRREAQESFEQQMRAASFRIDPAMRYYVLSDFHLEPDAAEENPALLKLLGRLLSEGGIGGVFLLGDLAARPGIGYDELSAAHPRLFDTLFRLTTLIPVFLVQGECDLQLEPPEFLRCVERFEDESWIFLHGYQYDPATEVQLDDEGEVRAVHRAEPDPAAALAGLRALHESTGKQIVFGHLHRAAYVEPGLVCVGHWTEGAADYGIVREGKLYLSQGRPGF